MRRALRTAVVALALALVGAAPAGADVVTAEGGAGGAGHKLLWNLAFDDAADTLTVNATHTRFDGAVAAGDPQAAGITLTLSNGQGVRLNLLGGELFNATNGNSLGLFDGTPGSMLNTGDRTRTNVRLRVSAGRAKLISFSTQYQPPGA